MKIALLLNPDHEQAQFASQIGIQHAIIGGPNSPNGYLEYDTLQQAQEVFAAHGIEISAVENVPVHFYDKVMAGLPGRDEQIDNYCTTIHNLSRAGIHILGYHWMLLGGITSDYVRGRGGARERHFDWEAANRSRIDALEWRGPDGVIHVPDQEVSTEQMWDNVAYFLQRVLPVAESCGVKLAAHPDDAPIPSFMGVARILGSLEGLQRLLDTVPSPSNGLDFCQGTIAEMTGVNVVDAIYRFGKQHKIFFAHYRAVQGQVPDFTEVFMDEGGNDMYAAMKAYKDVGFTGPMRADHSPAVIGDNRQAHRGFAFEIGYMKGMAQAVDALSAQTH